MMMDQQENPPIIRRVDNFLIISVQLKKDKDLMM